MMSLPVTIMVFMKIPTSINAVFFKILRNDQMSSESNRLIAKNTAMLYFRRLFTMAVSLYTSRIVLSALGVRMIMVFTM